MAKQRTIVLKDKPPSGRKRVQERVTVKEQVPVVAPAVASPLTVAQDMRTVDIEKLSRNIAKMVEEGGKALAAYLKPREEGEVKAEPSDEIADVVKTLGH